MKAVIPVAGLGTRMLPATKAIPKEMLPVVDKPLIQWVVNEVVQAGIKEIILVTHASKNSIENHFDKSFELEATLEQRVKRTLLDEVQNIIPEGVSILSVRQGEPKGLGHAISKAKPLIGNEPFAVILPDVLVIDKRTSREENSYLREMVLDFQKTKKSQILVEEMSEEQLESYGVVKRQNNGDIEEIVEKPPRGQAPSNLAVVGRYVFSEDIWPLLNTPADKSGEIQLTDAIAALIESGHDVHAFTKGVSRSYDCGSKVGYLKANVALALEDENIGDELAEHLKNLLNP